MQQKSFSFSEQSFNRLFPFYFLLDRNLTVISVGKSMTKISALSVGDFFFSKNYIKRPAVDTNTYETLCGLSGQLVIIGNNEQPNLLLRGQLDQFDGDCLLFVGTPWFANVAQLKEHDLTINDFSIHDSIVDLLNLVQTQEITNSEMRELIQKINQQGTKLRLREEELQATTNRLSLLIANIRDPLLMEDEHQNVVFMNEAFRNVFGLDEQKDKYFGESGAEITKMIRGAFKYPDQYRHSVERLVESNEATYNEVIELKDGRVFTRDFNPVIINGKNKGYVWKYVDITDSKLQERQLSAQKQFYEQILNRIPADIVVFDSRHRYLFVNPVAIKNPDLRKWMIGKDDEEYCDYRNRDQSIARERRRIFNNVVASKEQLEWEEQLLDPDGNYQYHLRKMFPVFDQQGDLEIMIGYGVNITERRKIEEQVRRSEERYRSIFDNSQALICTHSLDGKIIEVNKAVEKTLGFSIDELIGIPIHSLLPESKRAEFDDYYLEAIRKQGKAEGIMVANDRSGHDVFLLYQNFLVSGKNDQPYVIGFAQDITARINAEVALKKSEEKYRGLIENMNLGMVEVAADNTVIFANNSFIEMSGYDSDALTGRKIGDLFSTNDNIEIANEAIERRRQGKSDAYEILVKNKQGEMKWWLVSGTAKMDVDGNYVGSLGIYLDITPQKTMEIELRKAKNDAELSAYSKELFLANMSHEIRTPMNAIIGIGRLLGKTGLDAQQKYYLDIIENASGNLLVIINDLLDFSKIEAGKVTLEQIGFSLGKITENVIHILKHKCEEKNLSIKYQCSEEIEPVLIGDPYRINQILINLVGNSIKFTERGGITVRCSVESKSLKDQSILFEVEDSGIGMSEEFLSHIFDKFTQEDEGITRKFGGTGLGMSISKQLIELMGGEIAIQSVKNIGTHISFRISFAIGSKNDLPSAWNHKPDTAILHGKQILLVEDNYMNRVLASTILKQYGASITEAVDGEKAIEKLRSQKFDLILMDIHMPVKDGIEATKFIRENLDNTTPIIAMTANAYKREEERCLAVGMNDFISKPFEEERFIYQIAQWLGASTANTVFPQHETEVTFPELFDLSKLIATSRGDEQFIVMMLQMFVTEIPNAVKELQDAAELKDYSMLGAIAHRIRPSVLSFGINTLDVSLQKLERFDREFLGEEQSLTIAMDICAILKSVVASFQRILESKNLSDCSSSVISE